MARVGVVSIYDMNNVGNRLQNYALCRALEDLGHTPVVIPTAAYAPRAAGNDAAETRTAAPGPESIVDTARRLVGERDWWGLADKARRAALMQVRRRQLTRFTHENLRVEPRAIAAPGDGEALRDDYDLFVAGSDQVWNPHFRFGCPTDFLTFARPEQRLAYAASFGVSELPPEFVGPYRDMLAGIERISVRERSGARLLEELDGRNVPVVLDPTMLLDVADWHRLADRAPRPAPQPYLATYLLWTSDRATHRAVDAAARTRQLLTRALMAPAVRRPGFYGVEGFLRTIREADVVVTDSFHSTLFAILFRTPVRVLSRGPGQDDRIESLLELFDVDPAEAFGRADEPPAGPLVADPDAVLSGHSRRSLEWLAAATGS